MDVTVATMLGVLCVIAVNQLVMRIAGLRGRPWVFYTLQVLNLLVGAALLWFGLPGFEQWPVVGWMLGLLVFFRVVQNNSARTEYLREQTEDAEVDARRAALAAALRRGEAAKDEGKSDPLPDPPA